MYLTILKIILPYAQKLAAEQITAYLNRRREQAKEAVQHLKDQMEESAECPPCPPCPEPASAISADASYNFFSTTNTIFFALSGILLGGALTAIFYVFWRDFSSQE